MEEKPKKDTTSKTEDESFSQLPMAKSVNLLGHSLTQCSVVLRYLSTQLLILNADSGHIGVVLLCQCGHLSLDVVGLSLERLDLGFRLLASLFTRLALRSDLIHGLLYAFAFLLHLLVESIQTLLGNSHLLAHLLLLIRELLNVLLVLHNSLASLFDRLDSQSLLGESILHFLEDFDGLLDFQFRLLECLCSAQEICRFALRLFSKCLFSKHTLTVLGNFTADAIRRLHNL
eukprot:m.278772 g.278772  ORF g.278772 m.278772 type:complete len:231 (+) comp54892_c0_seq2:1569-2261(+)